MLKIIKADNNEHLEALMKLRLEMLREVQGLSEDYVFSQMFTNQLREYFTSGDHTTVLSFIDGKPAGCASMCYLTVMPTYEHPSGKRAKLMNVYMRPAFRKEGIASAMIGFLIEEAKDKGISEITLDATESGRKLYRKFGFEPSEEYMVLNFEKQLQKRISQIEKYGFHSGCGC